MESQRYKLRITRIHTNIKSLQIIGTFFEQLGLFLGPVFHRLKGRTVAQCVLRDVLIVDLCLWRSWFGQAMFAAVGGADAIKCVGTRGLALTGGAETIGKFLTIIGEDLGDREGGLVDQAREETADRGG